MRICIYGAGAMGTVLGAFLCKEGVPVDLVSRNAEHIQALKENGAHIIGKTDFTVRVNALFPSEMNGKYDLIFLMTKQKENEQIVTFLKDFLPEDGALITTQNGLPEEMISSLIGKDRTYGAVTVWGANLIGKGVSELTSEVNAMSFSVGCLGIGSRLEEIASILSKVGAVTVVDNLLGARWAKLMINATFSGLSTITGLTFGEIANNKNTRRIAQATLKECIEVGLRKGITIEKIQGHDVAKLLNYHTAIKKWISFQLIPIAMKNHASLVSGMLLDLKRGKQVEIDYITGIISRSGKEVGYPTPCSDTIVQIVHGIEEGKYSISPDNLCFFKETV